MKKLNLTTTELKEMERAQKTGKIGSILGSIFIISMIIGILSAILNAIFNISSEDDNLVIRAITGIIMLFLTSLLALNIYETIKNDSEGLGVFDFFTETTKNNSGWKLFGATTLIFLLSAFASMFLIFPGIIVMITLSHTIYVLRDTEGIKIWDAMKVSSQRMKGNSMLLFSVYARYILLPILLLIGMIIVAAIFFVGTALNDFMGGLGNYSILAVLFGTIGIGSLIFLFIQRGKLMIAEAIFHNEITKINEEDYPEYDEIVSEEKREDEVIKL